MHRLELESETERERRAPAEHLDSVVTPHRSACCLLQASCSSVRPCLEHAGVSRAPPPQPAGLRRQLQRGDVDLSRPHAAHAPSVLDQCIAISLRLALQTTWTGLIYSENDACPRSLFFNRLPQMCFEFSIPIQATILILLLGRKESIVFTKEGTRCFTHSDRAYSDEGSYCKTSCPRHSFY